MYSGRGTAGDSNVYNGEQARPQCGPCAKGQRDCVYAPRESLLSNGPTPTESENGAQFATHGRTLDSVSQRRGIQEPLQALAEACHRTQPHQQPGSAGGRDYHLPEPTASGFALSTDTTRSTSRPPNGYGPSPGTDSSVSTRLAPLSWFELLATDAANADERFLLSPPQLGPGPQLETEDPRSSSNLRPRTLRERESFYLAAFPRDPEIEQRLASQPPGDGVVTDDPLSWTTSSQIALSALENRLFKHFVLAVSQWLDFYDPEKHFQSVVPHLALRNVGLMRALLALSARHLSLHADQQGEAETGLIDRNLAVQYYYETLHYLNKAMQYPSYARSHEVIATSLLISTYEMIDGSNQDWERHLKGVFWIQRFQDNDGESGGLRQAVWWAWLRQDVWVAMRERRRVFSFWQPKKPLSALTASGFATRATYLLAQCVNYSSKEEQDTTDRSQRVARASELLYLLQEWHDHLPREYASLPTISDTDTFPPTWVHPPPYAAALQIHSLARILVILNRPSSGGAQDYRATQTLLTLSVNTICGIARAVDECDSAASLVSTHCLFGGKFNHSSGFGKR